jgi:hypothetical protein
MNAQFSRVARLHGNKTAHFRMWKSGKAWLFGAALLVTLSGAGFLPQTLGIVQPKSIYADTLATNTLTIMVPASSVPAGASAYIWQWGTLSPANSYQALTLNSSGTYWVGTFSPAAGASFIAGYSANAIAGSTSWDNGFTKLTGDTSLSSSQSAPVLELVENGASMALTIPVLTASALPAGTVGVPYDLSATPATLTDPSHLGAGVVTSYSITGPSGTTFSGATFTPDASGQYTVTYTYAYTTPAGTAENVTTTATVQVGTPNHNTITTPASGPTFNQLAPTDLSASAQGVTDSGAETPTIQSVSFTPDGSSTPQTLSADASGKYTFPNKGSYSITYTDSTGATGVLSGNVAALPAIFTPVSGASTTGALNASFDTASLVTLTDPNNKAITTANARIKVTGPSNSQFSGGIVLSADSTQFTPDVSGTYTVDYAYVDGTGTTQTTRQTITIGAQPTLNASGNFENSIVVSADTSGNVAYDSTVQGVSVTDETAPLATPTVTLVNTADQTQTPLVANAGGTYTLNVPAGDVLAQYLVQWSYPNAAPSSIEQSVTVLANGYTLPLIAATSNSNIAVNAVFDPKNGLTVTDSTKTPVDAVTALADGTLTIEVYDPAGAPVSLAADSTFIPEMIGNYSVVYTYTDPATGLLALTTSTVMSLPTGIAGTLTENLAQPETAYTFAPSALTKTGTAGAQTTYTDANGLTVSVVDPQNTLAPTDSNFDNGTLVFDSVVDDASGNAIAPSADGTYLLAPGTYTPTYTYTAHDPNNGQLPLSVQIAGKLVIHAAPTLSGQTNATHQLTGTDTTFRYTADPNITASDGSTVAISSVVDASGASVIAQFDGSYALPVGTYTITYTSPLAGSVSETVTITPAPVTVTISYRDASTSKALTPQSSVALTGNVGESVRVPAAPTIAGYTPSVITYNGASVSADSQILLTANAALNYTYTPIPSSSSSSSSSAASSTSGTPASSASSSSSSASSNSSASSSSSALPSSSLSSSSSSSLSSSVSSAASPSMTTLSTSAPTSQKAAKNLSNRANAVLPKAGDSTQEQTLSQLTTIFVAGAAITIVRRKKRA